MTILTEKEREDIYKYWLHSSTLTDEDGLIQLAEKAVLEKLAGMELPDPETFETWNAKQHGDPEEIGFLQALRIAYCCGQDSVDQKQVYAQGSASQLAQEPKAWQTLDGEGGYEYRSYEENEAYAEEWDKRNPNHKGWVEKLYTLKEAK